jgi:hypothetical protein
MALIALKETFPTPTPTSTLTKLNKPPPHREDEPEVQEFEGQTWKWCDKCFGVVLNRTHITSERQKGKGHKKQHQPPPDTTPSSNWSISSPQANLAEANALAPQGNNAQSNNCGLDFMQC